MRAWALRFTIRIYMWYVCVPYNNSKDARSSATKCNKTRVLGDDRFRLRFTVRHTEQNMTPVAYLGGGPRCDAPPWPDHENFLRRLCMKRCVFCRFPARIAKFNNVWWSFFIPTQYAIKIAMWDCIWYDAEIFCVSEFQKKIGEFAASIERSKAKSVLALSPPDPTTRGSEK